FSLSTTRPRWSPRARKAAPPSMGCSWWRSPTRTSLISSRAQCSTRLATWRLPTMPASSTTSTLAGRSLPLSSRRRRLCTVVVGFPGPAATDGAPRSSGGQHLVFDGDHLRGGVAAVLLEVRLDGDREERSECRVQPTKPDDVAAVGEGPDRPSTRGRRATCPAA